VGTGGPFDWRSLPHGGRSRGLSLGAKQDRRIGLHGKFAVAGVRLQSALRFAKEETGGLQAVFGEPHDERNLPGFGEEAVEDGNILGREENPAAGVGMEPADGLEACELTVLGRGVEEELERGLVVFRQDEPRSAGVLADDGTPLQNADCAGVVNSEKDGADLDTAMGDFLEALFGFEAQLFEHLKRVLDG
jgi:hypothetical protein